MKRAKLLLVCLAVLAIGFQFSQAATDEEIEQSIVQGLAWLAGQQNAATGSFGLVASLGKTGLAVKKFEHEAIETGYSSPLDPSYPYHEVVAKGLDYLFLNMSIVTPLPVQNHDGVDDDPDTDGDGMGVCIHNENYYTGIALMAVAESNSPDRIVDVPGSAVDGWTYYQVAVDLMNWLAYAQSDMAPDRGGWGYGANGWADQSNSGYATLGLGVAQAPPPHGFGITTPQFVLDEMNHWIGHIQNPVDGDALDGGGYTYGPSDVGCLATGNLIYQMRLYGDDVSDQRVQDAVAYLVRAWNLPGVPIGGWWSDYQGWLGNYQAMFTVMKGLEAYNLVLLDTIPPLPTPIDWFDDMSDYIVATQDVAGSWPTDFWDTWVGGDQILSTIWALLTLQKAVPPSPEVTVAFDIKPTSCPNPLNAKKSDKDMAAKIGDPSPWTVIGADIKAPVLPVAILGTEDFDVRGIDPTTLTLMGVPATRWAFEDVTTPVHDDAEMCECTTAGPDGYEDLTVKFDQNSIVAALGVTYDGQVIPLTITGMTYDGIPIEGVDCVVIRGKKDDGYAYAIDPESVTSLVGANPNPFNPITSISFNLARSCEYSVTIYNIAGQVVRSFEGMGQAGLNEVIWDASGSASGVYFYRLSTEEFADTKKMLLLK